MKTLLRCLTTLALLASCQPGQPPSPTMPGTPAKPRVQYRLIFLKQESKHESDSELYFREFESKVDQAMTEGWQPLGGVSMTFGFPVQAMVKTQ